MVVLRGHRRPHQRRGDPAQRGGPRRRRGPALTAVRRPALPPGGQGGHGCRLHAALDPPPRLVRRPAGPLARGFTTVALTLARGRRRPGGGRRRSRPGGAGARLGGPRPLRAVGGSRRPPRGDPDAARGRLAQRRAPRRRWPATWASAGKDARSVETSLSLHPWVGSSSVESGMPEGEPERRATARHRGPGPGLRDHRARPPGRDRELEPRGRAGQGLHRRGGRSAAASAMFYPEEDRRSGLPLSLLARGPRRGPGRAPRLARAQGRHPFLGRRRDHRGPRRRRATTSGSPR